MPRFISLNYQQSTMVVINYFDQLQAGTFEHAIHHLIDSKLDLSVFYPKYKNDKNGRPAYDPAALLKIILFAYSKGITSSREIQWCCETNVIFKALSCDSVPHWTTIAAFVSGRKQEIESVFEQVLLICHEHGLLGNELFAIDGCKMSSNAAKEWSGTFKELQEKRDKLKRQISYHMNEHEKLDNNEEADEARKQRTAQAIDTLNKAHDKIEKFLNEKEPRMGKGKRPQEVKSNITDNESGKMTTSKGTIQGYNGVATVDKKHQIIVDATVFGEGQEHHTLKPVLEGIQDRFKRLAISDDILKAQTIITADTGFANEKNMQYLHTNGINAYIPDNRFRSRDPKFNEQKTKYGKRHQSKKERKVELICASEFSFDPINMTCICPMGETMWETWRRTETSGGTRICFEGKIRACRNCEKKHQCLRNPSSPDKPKGHGRLVSFLIDDKPRPPNYTDWMKHRVDSPQGKQIYSHRMSVVEPVFGNIGTNKKLKRFSLRGKDKVQGQWYWFCLIHNLEKLNNYGQLAA
ncbi:IS1182 family transposase [uncultured Paraglaciecola sp.]|uniref:IS1182 family transposase n=1 Tax=uncultured Paraglaciecola sp. TaxID=1765024 RepID=UPI0025E0E55D|nr:IS1182 family transposase [uncultured Paraglaciecola sp.]